jgi:hypothetical protein
MLEQYAGHGVRFLYPRNWNLQEQPGESGVSVSVNGPETSFWTITVDFDGPDPQQMIQAAVAAFREEYSELDVYAVETQICHRTAVGRDLEFICLDMLNTACLRSFRTGRFTVFILFQGCDAELEETRPVLEAITHSLECDGDEELFGDEG